MDWSNHALEIKNLTVSYGIAPVLWDINLKIPKGSITAVMGPNGAGKSTLIKTILGLLKPVTGQILFPPEIKNKKGAVAYVPQSENIDWDFPATVEDVVLMGRYANLGWFKQPKKEDILIGEKMLEKTGMAEFKTRHINQLSGGQKQRVFLARALSQEAELYFMDEPFKGIDVKTEKIIMALFKELKEQNKTIIVVHHDLNTAKEYFDNIVFINTALIAQGSADSVFNSKNIKKTYRLPEDINHG